MAELNSRIKPKKSSVSGEVPQAADLEVAELAVNTADGKLFVKHTDNTIKEISGSGGGGGTILPFFLVFLLPALLLLFKMSVTWA